MYKQAAQLKLRFKSSKGYLTVEDLFDLSLEALDAIAIDLNEKIEKNPKKSFITDLPKEDKISVLKLNIVVDVINTKKEKLSNREKAEAMRAKKALILEAMAKKRDAALENMTLDELQAELEKLDK